MGATTGFAVFEYIETEVMGKAEEFIDSAGNLMQYIAPIAAAAFSLYVVLVIWSYVNRGLEEPIHDFTRRMVGWMLVIALAFNGGNYSKLSHMIINTPEEISQAFTNTTISGNELDKAIVKTVDRCKKVLDDIAKNISLDDLVWIVTWVAISILSTVLMMMFGAFLCMIFSAYLAAKLLLIFLLLLGPVALAGMLFPATRQYGMNWASSCVSGIFQLVLYTIVFALALKMLEKPLNFQLLERAAEKTGSGAVTIFLMSIVRIAVAFILFHFVVVQVPALTSGVFNGAQFTGSGFASSIAGFGNRATGFITGPANMLYRNMGRRHDAYRWKKEIKADRKAKAADKAAKAAEKEAKNKNKSNNEKKT